MMQLSVRLAKGSFFDRKAVIAATEKAERKALSHDGAIVMREARRLISRPLQKKRKELSASELIDYKQALVEWKLKGKQGPKPLRPQEHSKPGEPPKLITGLLKKFLFFVWDAASRSVVIGPAKLNKPGEAPSSLEFGGFVVLKDGSQVSIKPRPYMGPALRQVREKLMKPWAGSLHE